MSATRDSHSEGAPQSQRSGSLPPNALKRGEACIICRRKKMRCDGKRPHCGQCSLTQRPEDCEYTDKQGRTNTEILEERFRELQARIKELERQSVDKPVFLHDPYTRHRARAHEQRPKPITPGVPSGPEAAALHQSSFVHIQTTMESGTDVEVNLHALLRKRLISLPGASTSNLVLHLPSLARYAGLPQENPDHLHTALRSAISLWLIDMKEDLMDDDELSEAQLELVLAALPGALASNNAAHRMQAIQAEVLLALHFFRHARLLEGHYHASSAATASLGCRLHRLGDGDREMLTAGPARLLGTDSMLELSPPKDALELGERIKLFWTVYSLDSCWSVALDRPTAIPADTVITTPLPARWEEYENMTIQQVFSSTQTLCGYLDGSVDYSSLTENVGHLLHVAYVISAAFFGTATSLIRRHTGTGGTLSISGEFVQSVTSLDDSIRKFQTVFHSLTAPLDTVIAEAESTSDYATNKRSTPTAPSDPVEGTSVESGAEDSEVIRDKIKRSIVFVRSLANASIIQLHYALTRMEWAKEGSDNTPTIEALDSINRCISAAHEIALVLREYVEFGDGQRGLGELDIFIGVIWQSASRVLVDEATHIIKSPALSSGAGILRGDAGELEQDVREVQVQARMRLVEQDVDALQAAMRELGRTSLLVATQAEMLELSR